MRSNLRVSILIFSLLTFVLVPKIIFAKEATNISTIINSEIQTEIKKHDLAILNFWATWCTPCIQEIPELIKVQKEFKDKKIGVIFANMAEDKKDVLKFLKKKNLGIETFYEASETAEKLGFETLPYSFIINKDLEIVEVIRGSNDFKDFSKLLQKHIASKK